LSWDEKCQFERCTILFSKYYNIDPKIKDTVARMGIGICGSLFPKEKIENSYENQICIQGGVISGDPYICECN
jgi:hypothetical protein